MKLATWNVSSLKIRLPQLADWLEAHRPDHAPVVAELAL